MFHSKIRVLISTWVIYFMTTNCLLVCGRPINEITTTRATPETEIPAEFSYSTGEALKPSEIQKAVCTVTSGDVRASAEAFTTRELKGVCGSIEMLKSFNDLENKLSHELRNIQQLVVEIHRQFVLHNTVAQNFNESSKESNTAVITPATFKFQPIAVENKPQKAIELGKNYYLAPKLKSLATKDAATREKEISKYDLANKTNKNVKVYTYYWRLENFSQSIKSAKNLSRASPIFVIRAKAFKIKAHFQHLHRDYLYLQLEDCSSNPQLAIGNSIILDTGDIFKEIQSDNFKYKMSILDQNKEHSSDLVSQEFDNYDTGFSIPNSALIDSPFIKDDSLLIQLHLYF